MSEGKPGPSRSKLRAIWRTEKRKRDELADRIKRAELAGSTPSVTALELLAMYDRTLAGQTPVGITHTAWRATCDEMNAAEVPTVPDPKKAAALALAFNCPACSAPIGHKCKRWDGGNCAPHRQRIALARGEKPEAEPAAPPDLFSTHEGNADA